MKHLHRVIIVALCTLGAVQSILTNGGTETDITADPNFNCRWYGGSAGKLECNCLTGTEEFTIKENSIPPYDLYAINITNCGRITLAANAISSMRSLRSLTFENIRALYLQPNGAQWIGFMRNTENLIDWDPTIPSLKLRIVRSHVEEIANNAIRGRFNEIALIDSDIAHIAPFGVSNLQQSLQVYIDGTRFHAVDPQAFKKFTTEKLIIKNAVFDTVPSRAFYDIIAREMFILDNVTVLDTVKPAGFIVSDPYLFEVVNSRMNTISGESFRVATRGSVAIRNNWFNNTGIGAFRAISLNKEDPNAIETIRFERNVFATLSKDALVVDRDSFRAEFANLQISELCECENLERYFRNGENTLELNCLNEEEDWVSVEHFRSTACSMLDTRSGAAYIIAGVAAIALLLVLSGVALYFWHANRSKSYGNEPTDKNGKLSMIVPDGRTYRETELHVIVERADLLTTDL